MTIDEFHHFPSIATRHCRCLRSTAVIAGADNPAFSCSDDVSFHGLVPTVIQS